MSSSHGESSGEPLLVGLDMGSTSVKAVIYERTGRAVAMACVPAAIHYPQPPGRFTIRANCGTRPSQVLREATSQVDDPRRIACIAVASVGEAGVPLDAKGEPTHEFIAWFDRRTLKQQARLEQALEADRIYEITGQASAPIFGVLKQLWIKENHPDAWARTVRWLNVADYVAFRLSGEQATDWSLACRSASFDIRKRVWSDEILDAVGIDRDLLRDPGPERDAGR